jgi:anthranilate synthase component 1
MYQPDRDTFWRRAEQGALIPVFRELPADLETPVSVFLKLGGTPPCFLLESVERGEQLGRYSFLGTNPSLVVRAGEEGVVIWRDGEVSRMPLDLSQVSDPLGVVQNLLKQYPVAKTPGLPRFFGGAVGYLSYDMVRFFEKLPDCPCDELHLPDTIFLFTDSLVIFDHVQHKMKIVSIVPTASPTAYQEAVDKIEAVIGALGNPVQLEPRNTLSLPRSRVASLESNFTAAQFARMVEIAKEYILAGDAFQIVLSQRLRRCTTAAPFDIYRALRMLNPSPYMFYLDFGDFQLIGSSPEMLVRLEEGRAITRPIAGTRPRGRNEEEDAAIISSLLADPKERAEHVMLVDLGRNDLGRVCRYGTVRVPLYMSTEKYSHVIHIVSSVEGELREDYDAFSLLRACFPAGTVSGAPKIRAMEIINELEKLRRGPYAGAVGYFGFGGNMDTCITIRTVVMKGDTVYLQGGAGIVADSQPLREYEESLKKIEVLENAVRLAESWRKSGGGKL